jgi:hypothetical protein
VLVTIVGLLIVLLAAFWVAWPLLAGVAPEPVAAEDPGTASPEHEKELALLAIREADFDHQTGKLSDEDHAALRAELEARALSAIAAIDDANALHPVPSSGAVTGAPTAGGAPAARGPGEAGGFCPACGVRFARGARFCSGCGKKLPAATARGRRRA